LRVTASGGYSWTLSTTIIPAVVAGAGRLRRVGSQQLAIKRGSIEALDDRLHLFGIRRLDESETLGFLCFWAADYFDGIADEVFSHKP
jgi:hypothetical protein